MACEAVLENTGEYWTYFLFAVLSGKVILKQRILNLLLTLGETRFMPHHLAEIKKFLE